MIEKFLSNEISLPPILALKKKTSIEIPFSNKRSSQEYTPSRVRNIPLSKTLTQKSMPLIGTEDHSYKFTITQGNNHQIVRKVLNSRTWWLEIPSYNTLFNFNWQPISSGVKFDRLILSPFKQMVNHFEGQKELSSKLNLLKNLQNYCEENQKFLFDILPITYFLDLDHLEKFDSEFQDFLNCFQSKTSLYKPTVLNIGPYNLMQKNQDKKHFLYSQPRNYSTLNSGHNVWILKPADYNRGRGIRLFNNLDDLQSILLDYEKFEFDNYKVTDRNLTIINKPSMNFIKFSENNAKEILNREELKKNILKVLRTSKLKTRRFIIQKYIENPFLINQRKFDIRVWVLINHEMNIYFFREGYARTSSEIYNLNEEGLDNPFIHLTNNAIQKNSDKYGTFEKGNQISFHHLDKYFRDSNYKLRIRKNFVPKMKEIILLSFKAVQGKLNPNKRRFCCEIFGFDFMIDTGFSLWLLEINTNPCLEESSPLLKQLIPRMLDDAFQLSIDKIFPKHRKGVKYSKNFSENTEKKSRIFKVNGYSDNENLWELIGNIENDDRDKI